VGDVEQVGYYGELKPDCAGGFTLRLPVITILREINAPESG